MIPCFRSSSALKSLVSDLTELARKQLQRFEIVLVRDSTDPDTNFLLEEIAKTHKETRVIRLSRNFGQQAATVAGITETIGEVVVTLDDDYQHRPGDALEMLATLANQPDLHLVYGRPLEASDSRNRIFAGGLFRLVLKYGGLRFADSLSPFRAFRGYFREAFRSATGPNVSVDVILSWIVDSVATRYCDFNPRTDGVSGYSTRKLIGLAFGVLIAFSTRPLSAGVYIGVAGVSIAVIYALAILARFLVGGISVPGFATIALLVLFLGSLQLLILGLIGTYLGQQHRRSMSQPAYFVVRADKKKFRHFEAKNG